MVNRIFSWEKKMEKKDDSMLLGVLKVNCSCTQKRMVMTTFTAEDVQISLHCKECNKLWNVAIYVEEENAEDIEEKTDED